MAFNMPEANISIYDENFPITVPSRAVKVMLDTKMHGE